MGTRAAMVQQGRGVRRAPGQRKRLHTASTQPLSLRDEEPNPDVWIEPVVDFIPQLAMQVWPLSQQNRSVLLHGDFWPGNILWRDGQIVGVIDWEDAALGDPLADVANSRLELLWAFGIEAMQRFTHHYQSLAGIDFANLPYWELYAALRRISQIAEWGLDEITEKTMRERLRWFIAQAFMNL